MLKIVSKVIALKSHLEGEIKENIWTGRIGHNESIPIDGKVVL